MNAHLLLSPTLGCLEFPPFLLALKFKAPKMQVKAELQVKVWHQDHGNLS